MKHEVFGRRIVLAVVLGVVLVSGASAQEFSEKKEIAIFGLSYVDVPLRIEIPAVVQEELQIDVIVDDPRRGRGRGSNTSYTVTVQEKRLQLPSPNEVRSSFARAFANIDNSIRQTFMDLGRFIIVGETFALSETEVDEFISLMRQYREEGAELPENVRLGRQSFTEADFRRLISGYVLVIPSVSNYTAELTDDAEFQVTIEVAFAFINMESGETFERFTLDCFGSGENMAAAINSAVDDIPYSLSYRIRQVEEFQIKTGITDLVDNRILIEFGENMGLMPGDEFAIVQMERVGTYDTEQETGLLYLTEVRENFSFAVPIYASPAPQIGDQLKEIPRAGVEFEIYGGVQSLNMTGTELMPVIGISAVGSRGFFPVRPILRFEVPFTFAYSDFSSVEGEYYSLGMSLGAEYLLILGKLRVSPYALVGATFGTFGLGGSEEEEPTGTLGHFGVSGGLRLGYHLNRDSVLYIEPGFMAYVGLDMASIIGPSLNIGIEFK